MVVIVIVVIIVAIVITLIGSVIIIRLCVTQQAITLMIVGVLNKLSLNVHTFLLNVNVAHW